MEQGESTKVAKQSRYAERAAETAQEAQSDRRRTLKEEVKEPYSMEWPGPLDGRLGYSET